MNFHDEKSRCNKIKYSTAICSSSNAYGRKNYLFSGNHDAAANIANYYTIFGTCKKQGVNPYNYLVWCLERINGTNIQAIHSISPASYKKIFETKDM